MGSDAVVQETDRRPLPEAPPSISSWGAIDLSPVLRGERTSLPPSALARDDGIKLLYPGRINLAMGETESLKSWFGLIAAQQELAEGRHVLYIDFEDTEETAVERLKALGVTDDQIADRFSYVRPEERFDNLATMVVEDIIAARGSPTVAIVDGVTEAMAMAGLKPDSGSDVTSFYASFPRWLARTGAAVMLVDHVTKSTDGRGRWAIGSERKISGLTGAAFALEVISPFGRGKTGKVKVTVSKDRCGHLGLHEGERRIIAIMELRSRPAGGVTSRLEPPPVGRGDGSFRPTTIMERLSTAIEGDPGLTKNGLRAAVSGKNDAKDLALKLLVDEGFVEVRAGRNRSQLHSSLKPFRAAGR
jgi:hypothetical protein